MIAATLITAIALRLLIAAIMPSRAAITANAPAVRAALIDSRGGDRAMRIR
jgi:hypothetical protein